MRISTGGNLIVETPKSGVRVMRFARPDLRQNLDDAADSATSELFQEIQDAVLSELPNDWTLVVNLGLVGPINAAFYRCLLHVRKCVQARNCRLVLCGLTPWHQEIFELFRGPEVFTIVATEAEARREIRAGLEGLDACRHQPRPGHREGTDPTGMEEIWRKSRFDDCLTLKEELLVLSLEDE